MLTVLQGDCREVLKTLPESSVHCCVTSPPYWNLRDYGMVGQAGLEETPEDYVALMVAVFSEVWRVLRLDGTLWLNLGDTYNAYNACRGPARGINKNTHEALPDFTAGYGLMDKALKPKDMIGVPWMVAFALRGAGWYLRSDIIWHKPNPMPESVTDRPTKSHEYIFLLSKSQRYHYDADAIKEQGSPDTHVRYARGRSEVYQAPGQAAQRGAIFSARPNGVNPKADHDGSNGSKQNRSFSQAISTDVLPNRNKRSVWTVNTAGFSEAHFATFPPDLIKPCILAGCPVGGVILDPFAGSGTTGMVALELGRSAILVELNPAYVELIHQRCNVTHGLAL